MRVLTILLFMLTLMPSAYSRPTDFGPDKNQYELAEQAAEAARKKAEEAARSFEARTKDSEREVQRNAILKLTEASIEVRKNAKASFNDNETLAKHTTIYKQNTQPGVNAYGVSFNQNINADLNRISVLRDNLSNKMSGILLSLYVNETNMHRDNFIQNLK